MVRRQIGEAGRHQARTARISFPLLGADADTADQRAPSVRPICLRQLSLRELRIWNLPTHILCCSWAICFRASSASENDHGNANLDSKTAPDTFDDPVEGRSQPTDNRMSNVPLDVSNGSTGMSARTSGGLVLPWLCQAGRQDCRLGLQARLHRVFPRQSLFNRRASSAHDNAGVGAANERSTIGCTGTLLSLRAPANCDYFTRLIYIYHMVLKCQHDIRHNVWQIRRTARAMITLPVQGQPERAPLGSKQRPAGRGWLMGASWRAVSRRRWRKDPPRLRGRGS